MTTMRERLERSASQQIAKAMLDGGVEGIVLNRDHIVMDRNTGARMPGLVNIPALIDAILSELATPTKDMIEAALGREIKIMKFMGAFGEDEVISMDDGIAMENMAASFTAMITHLREGK